MSRLGKTVFAAGLAMSCLVEALADDREVVWTGYQCSLSYAEKGGGDLVRLRASALTETGEMLDDEGTDHAVASVDLRGQPRLTRGVERFGTRGTLEETDVFTIGARLSATELHRDGVIEGELAFGVTAQVWRQHFAQDGHLVARGPSGVNGESVMLRVRETVYFSDELSGVDGGDGFSMREGLETRRFQRRIDPMTLIAAEFLGRRVDRGDPAAVRAERERRVAMLSELRIAGAGSPRVKDVELVYECAQHPYRD